MKPVVVILIHERSLTINYIQEKAAAIVDGWYLGEHTGTAIARTLFGDNNPGGKLAVTIPRSVGQLPVYYSQRATGTLKKSLFENSTPLFHFGFGLSYTAFSLDNLAPSSPTIKAGDSCSVTLTIKNTGKAGGDEVVQVYLKDVVGSVTRPDMALKAFKRVSLRVGETRQLSFVLDKTAFEMLNLKYERVVEPGEFKIYVGTSSRKKT